MGSDHGRAYAPAPGRDKLKRLRSLKHARGRAKEARFLVEGRRAISTAVDCGIALDVFVDERALTVGDRDLLEAVRAAGIAPIAISGEDLASVTDTVAPQAIVATAPIPTLGLSEALARADDLVLVIDGVQDPGNLGAILRVADAYAVRSAVLLAGTVDAWNPKVVRGAMGAHFHVGLSTAVAPDDAFAAFADLGFEPWIAIAHGGEPLPGARQRGKVALVIGGEATGPGATSLDRSARRVTVPTPGRAESLNVAVATGILLDRIAGRGA